MRKLFFTALLFVTAPTHAVDMCVTVSTTVAVRVVEAFTKAYNYEETINGQPNPETKGQFTRRKIREYVREVTVSYEAINAAETERLKQKNKSDSEITVE